MPGIIDTLDTTALQPIFDQNFTPSDQDKLCYMGTSPRLDDRILGIFAREEISKGKSLGYYLDEQGTYGKKIKITEAETYLSEQSRHYAWTEQLDDHHVWLTTAEKGGGILKKINTTNPQQTNIAAVIKKIKADQYGFEYIATRKIFPGEELLIDYGEYSQLVCQETFRPLNTFGSAGLPYDEVLAFYKNDMQLINGKDLLRRLDQNNIVIPDAMKKDLVSGNIYCPKTIDANKQVISVRDATMDCLLEADGRLQYFMKAAHLYSLLHHKKTIGISRKLSPDAKTHLFNMKDKYGKKNQQYHTQSIYSSMEKDISGLLKKLTKKETAKQKKALLSLLSFQDINGNTILHYWIEQDNLTLFNLCLFKLNKDDMIFLMNFINDNTHDVRESALFTNKKFLKSIDSTLKRPPNPTIKVSYSTIEPKIVKACIQHYEKGTTDLTDGVMNQPATVELFNKIVAPQLKPTPLVTENKAGKANKAVTARKAGKKIKVDSKTNPKKRLNESDPQSGIEHSYAYPPKRQRIRLKPSLNFNIFKTKLDSQIKSSFPNQQAEDLQSATINYSANFGKEIYELVVTRTLPNPTSIATISKLTKISPEDAIWYPSSDFNFSIFEIKLTKTLDPYALSRFYQNLRTVFRSKNLMEKRYHTVNHGKFVLLVAANDINILKLLTHLCYDIRDLTFCFEDPLNQLVTSFICDTTTEKKNNYKKELKETFPFPLLDKDKAKQKQLSLDKIKKQTFSIHKKHLRKPVSITLSPVHSAKELPQQYQAAERFQEKDDPRVYFMLLINSNNPELAIQVFNILRKRLSKAKLLTPSSFTKKQPHENGAQLLANQACFFAVHKETDGKLLLKTLRNE